MRGLARTVSMHGRIALTVNARQPDLDAVRDEGGAALAAEAGELGGEVVEDEARVLVVLPNTRT